MMEVMMERGGGGCGKGWELAFVVVMRVYDKMRKGLKIVFAGATIKLVSLYIILQPEGIHLPCRVLCWDEVRSMADLSC